MGREEKGRERPGKEGWDEDDTTGATVAEMAETRVGQGKGRGGPVTATTLLVNMWEFIQGCGDFMSHCNSWPLCGDHEVAGIISQLVSHY